MSGNDFETKQEKDNKQFAIVAAKLLREYSEQLRSEKELLDKYLNPQVNYSEREKERLRYLFNLAATRFHDSMSTYHKLARKVSQWLQNAKTSPADELELEIRLGTFESQLREYQHYYEVLDRLIE